MVYSYDPNLVYRSPSTEGVQSMTMHEIPPDCPAHVPVDRYRVFDYTHDPLKAATPFDAYLEFRGQSHFWSPVAGGFWVLTDAAAVIAVPLLGPRGIKGVLAVATDSPDRGFAQHDVELVEEVAARAGFALENAALYESMRSLALALQHSLLPAHLPTIDGAAVQVGYNPGDESDVGGDLYDVMELSSGRIGIAIGDVQGRGAHAAAVMGQLRAALRAYAVLDLEPAQVLTHLDDLVQGLNEALLVTCVYAVYDPFTRECVLANAGHPPPLLAGAHG